MTKKDAEFFFVNAGYSYEPGKETKTQGRKRYAKILANAEEKARDAGMSFSWEVDQCCNSLLSNDLPEWELWVCSVYDAHGRILTSLGGVDFGPGGAPWGESYRRVVEAELACEIIKQVTRSES
jgi:hypothetical protein